MRPNILRIFKELLFENRMDSARAHLLNISFSLACNLFPNSIFQIYAV